MGSILKTVLPLAGTIFGGPAGGAIGGALGGLIGGNQSQGQASGAYGTAQGQAELPGQLQQQYLPMLLQMLSGQQGANPFGATTRQNAQTNPLVFGDLATRNMTPVYQGQVSQYADNTAQQANEATNGLMHNLAGRGFGGATSFGSAQAGAIQRGAQQQVSGQKANIGGQAANAEQQLAQYQQQQQYEQGMNAGNTQYQRLLQMAGIIPGANISGIQAGGQYYQGQANNANNGFLNGLGSLSSILQGGGKDIWGQLGSIFGHGGGTHGAMHTGTENGDNPSDPYH